MFGHINNWQIFHLSKRVLLFNEMIINKLNNLKMGNVDSSEKPQENQNGIICRFPSRQVDDQYEQQPFTSISQQINKLNRLSNFQASKRKFCEQLLKLTPPQSFKVQFQSLDLSNYPELSENPATRRFSHNPDKSKQNLFQFEQCIHDNVETESFRFLKFIKEESVFDYYGVLQKIKKGERGQLYKVQQIQTTKIKIMKIISKVSFRDKNLIKGTSQIQNLLRLSHPYIVKLQQAYEDINKYYIILEKIRGTSLLDYMKKNRMSQEVGKHIIRQILQALQYIHKNGIIHRNLRLEHIMIQPSQDETLPMVRLIDFGMSLTVEQAMNENHTYGSIFYASPESLQHKINTKYDVWSVGILTLVLFLESEPSRFSNSNYLQGILKRGQLFRFHLKKLPMQIKEFVFELLTIKNKRRPSASQALKIEWISGQKGQYKSRIRKGVDIDQELSNRP